MNLADQWAHHIIDINSGVESASERDVYFSSTLALDKFCRNDFEHAWSLIIEIYEKYKDVEIVMDNLAAGPIEDLLLHHGEKALSKIKKYIEEAADFKMVLLGVWRNSIDRVVWDELQNLISDVYFD